MVNPIASTPTVIIVNALLARVEKYRPLFRCSQNTAGSMSRKVSKTSNRRTRFDELTTEDTAKKGTLRRPISD